MQWFSVRRDSVVLAVLLLSIVMIAAGLTGSSRTFGYAVVIFIGLLAGLGFVRRRDRSTWWPPILATLVLLVSLGGAFAFEDVPVHTVADTALGFQPGTAFVVYGLWIPTFFTLGLTYVLVFDRLADDQPAASAGTKGAR